MPLSKLELTEFLEVTNKAIVDLAQAGTSAVKSEHLELGDHISDVARYLERLQELIA